MSLLYTSQQIIVYSGIVLLSFGVFGNMMNIYIFSSVKAYRQTPSTFYFLIESIFKNIFLIINLLPRIIAFSYGYDYANISLQWCKFRQVLLMISATTSITLTCLCTIDQFFVTSSNVSLRRISQIKISYRIVLIIIIIWCLHSIPFYLYYGISSTTNTCVSLNPIITTYIPFLFLIIICMIPLIIMGIFGYLTYRNIRQTTVLAEQQADRQLLKMTFLQIILAFLCCFPLGIFHAYNAITSGIVKDLDRSMKEYLAYAIISTEITFYYASSFYIFLFSSSRFRRNIKERLLMRRHTMVVVPINHTR